jgi:ribosomal protein L14
MLNVIDNSGAAVAECINVLKMNRAAKVGVSPSASLSTLPILFLPLLSLSPPLTTHLSTGDRIIVVVQKQRNFGPESGPGGSVSVSAANKVRRGDIRHAVVVRTAKKYSRPDGSVVKFDDNACVLINKGGEPIGSRLSSVVGQELRGKKWSKILSLAPMHL